MENSNIKRNMKTVKDLYCIIIYLPTKTYTYKGETVADFKISFRRYGLDKITILETNGCKSEFYNCSFEIQRSNQESIGHGYIGDANTDGK